MWTSLVWQRTKYVDSKKLLFVSYYHRNCSKSHKNRWGLRKILW